MKNLSVYIHIPFCERKCLYCDFVSMQSTFELRESYVKRLVEEICSFDSTGYVVDSIFFGGGTPTLLSEQQFCKIVNAIKSNFKLDLKEFTVEGNPNSFSKNLVDCYKKNGVTRLSVGVQSLNDNVLKGIGRLHNASQAVDCVKMLCQSGLDINTDMMIGLAYQTTDIVKNDIKRILDLGINHLSCYSLILEQNTPIFDMVKQKKLTLPDDDTTVEMYDLVCDLAKKYGLPRYEISNFGKPCLHNLGYWTMKEYIGFGLSSHSLIKDKRFFNTSNIDEYLQNGKYILEEDLTLNDKMQEYIMLSLRTKFGIDKTYFLQNFGEDNYQTLLKNIDKDKKYYNINTNNISIKDEYIYVSNSLIEKLI